MEICTEYSFELMKMIEHCSDVKAHGCLDAPTVAVSKNPLSNWIWEKAGQRKSVGVVLDSNSELYWVEVPRDTRHAIVSSEEFVRHCARLKPKTEKKQSDKHIGKKIDAAIDALKALKDELQKEVW